jgi:hypothetical protein
VTESVVCSVAGLGLAACGAVGAAPAAFGGVVSPASRWVRWVSNAWAAWWASAVAWGVLQAMAAARAGVERGQWGWTAASCSMRGGAATT